MFSVDYSFDLCTIQLFEIILVYENYRKVGGHLTCPQVSQSLNGNINDDSALHKHGEPSGQFFRSNRYQYNLTIALPAEAVGACDIPSKQILIQLFILLLTVNLIYSTGNFLQNLFSHKRMPIEYFIIKAYFITVHILLVLILWRHYQVEEGIFFFMKSRSNFNFNKQLDKSKIKIRVTTLIVFSRDWI